MSEITLNLTGNTLSKGRCSQEEIAVHVHDLITHKRCLRKWDFTSPFRKHLQPIASANGGANPALWLGSGFHFALEDLEGYKRFGSASEAFMAYVNAHRMDERPQDWEEVVELGIRMVNCYQEWAEENKSWTVAHDEDGKPLVEAKYSLILQQLCHWEIIEDGVSYKYFVGEDPTSETARCYSNGEVLSIEELVEAGAEYREIVAHGTFDAIMEDKEGNWWILDYKTAKSFDTAKLDLDQQVSMYCWAASQYFGKHIEGMIYVQVSKNPPVPPKITKKGVSTDKRQRTTFKLYKKALIEHYGTISNAPAENIEFLDNLFETGYSQFVNVSWVTRSEAQNVSFYERLIAEGFDMLNPQYNLYPNPTKDCAWDCPFLQVCKAMEEGASWEYLLSTMFTERVETLTDDLRPYEIQLALTYPDKFPEWYEQATKHISKNVESVEDFMEKYK